MLHLQTYTYQDEHSAPFSWKTRSQQDLTTEFGPMEALTEEDLASRGLETLTTRASNALNRQWDSKVLRMSKGNPAFAKVSYPDTIRVDCLQSLSSL